MEAPAMLADAMVERKLAQGNGCSWHPGARMEDASAWLRGEVMGETVVENKPARETKLTPERMHAIVARAADELQVSGRRVLVLIPDGTRTMPMPLMFELLQQEIGARAAACDYLVALGTHPKMEDQQLSSLIGKPVTNGIAHSPDSARDTHIFNHRWDLPETFAEIGELSAGEVEQISGGLLKQAVPIRINRLIFDYDQVLICGPVFPHEVAGFSGGNKYLFPGISGREMIDWTHWLGALLGSYSVIGTPDTPVRAMIDRAAEHISVPVACLAAVVTHDAVHGLFFGPPREAWGRAAELSSEIHIEWIDEPFQRVLSIMPDLYDDIWTGAKGMYKVEPAIADGGEVVIYAPHITEFSYTHGKYLEQIGYHCRDYFLAQWDRFAEIPRGVIAHSTHLKGQGTYDAATGIEKPRINVTLATGISEERCRRMNLGYLDPGSIRLEDWQGRESEGVKVIPRAGEVLYRWKHAR